MCDPRELRGQAAHNGQQCQQSKSNVSSTIDGPTDHSSQSSDVLRLQQAVQQAMPTEERSPDSKCPICLDMYDNVAYLDYCWHRFCFQCVLEWSKNKVECPLCKQPFRCIIYNLRPGNDFEVHHVRPAETFAGPNGRRFSYRPALGENLGAVNPQRISLPQRMSSPDMGILFEELSTETTRQRDVEMRQIIREFTSRRRAILVDRSVLQIEEWEIIRFRKALYCTDTRIISIEDGGRFRDVSSTFLRNNPACLHRLIPWIRRELKILLGSRQPLINIVQRLIMNNVTRYNIDSHVFAHELRPFLLNYTEHFLHEFISYARCPFNVQAYDQRANYDYPAPSNEEGRDSDSSVITISPDETDNRVSEYQAFRSNIGHAPWDDETPGPSYFSSEQNRASSSTILDTSESSDEDLSANITGLQVSLSGRNSDSCDSSDNCFIVGYLKPLAERTPELVELSSDSEVPVDDRRKESMNNVQLIQLPSSSDTDASGYASSISFGFRDGTASNKNHVSLSSKKRKLKRSAKDKDDLSDASSLQSSSKEHSFDYSLSKRRKSHSYRQHSHRERHGLRNKRKHHSRKKRQKKREYSRRKYKKDKKRSRSRERSVSRKSQCLSPSSDSTDSRNLSRSRSQSNEYSRTSRGKEDDGHLRGSHQNNSTRAGQESSHWRLAEFSRQSRYSASPDYRRQPFSEETNSQYPRCIMESRNDCYKRYRSRSRSSNRSRTSCSSGERGSEKQNGKRKYKMRHLERAQRRNKETTSTKASSARAKPLRKHQAIYRRPSSTADRQAQADTQQEKGKKRSRSPSVEIIYEGNVTDKTTCHRKKELRSLIRIGSILTERAVV